MSKSSIGNLYNIYSILMIPILRKTIYLYSINKICIQNKYILCTKTIVFALWIEIYNCFLSDF